VVGRPKHLVVEVLWETGQEVPRRVMRMGWGPIWVEGRVGGACKTRKQAGSAESRRSLARVAPLAGSCWTDGDGQWTG
jgi:hypothetical protein